MIISQSNRSETPRVQRDNIVSSEYEEVCARLQYIFEMNETGGTRQHLKSAIDQALLHGLIPWANRNINQATSSFGILMYHRVTPWNCETSKPTWNVTPERLETQLSGLLKSGFQPVSLSEALNRQQNQSPLPPKAFVVTFDDGYANNLTYALPVLKKYKIPATIFLATAYLGQTKPFPSDDWDQAGTAEPESWRALTLPECHELLDSGLIEFGSHTHTHDDFRNRPEELRQDVEKSLEVLDSEFGIKQPTFAFPFGTRKTGFSSDELIDAARSTGVSCSLSTEHQMASLKQSPFEWGRFPAYQNDSAKTLAVKLSGIYSAAKNRLKNFL